MSRDVMMRCHDIMMSCLMLWVHGEKWCETWHIGIFNWVTLTRYYQGQYLCQISQPHIIDLIPKPFQYTFQVKAHGLFYLFKPFKAELWCALAVVFAVTTLGYSLLSSSGIWLENDDITRNRIILHYLNALFDTIRFWLSQCEYRVSNWNNHYLPPQAVV